MNKQHSSSQLRVRVTSSSTQSNNLSLKHLDSRGNQRRGLEITVFRQYMIKLSGIEKLVSRWLCNPIILSFGTNYPNLSTSPILDRVARGRRFQVKPCSDAEAAAQRLGLGAAGRSIWSSTTLMLRNSWRAWEQNSPHKLQEMQIDRAASLKVSTLELAPIATGCWKRKRKRKKIPCISI